MLFTDILELLSIKILNNARNRLFAMKPILLKNEKHYFLLKAFLALLDIKLPVAKPLLLPTLLQKMQICLNKIGLCLLAVSFEFTLLNLQMNSI